MDAKWEKLDNTLSDLWMFFIPPILNAIVILFVFQKIPKQIWAEYGHYVTEWQALAAEKSFTSYLVTIINEFSENSALFTTVSSTTISAFVSSIVALAIIVFILHKITIVISHVVFGRLNLKEESLESHPLIGGAIKKISPFLPEDSLYHSVHRKWEYAKSINDIQGNLSIYRSRRSKIISQIESNKAFATYSAVYFLLSVVSIFMGFSGLLVMILMFTFGMFFLFAHRYFDTCISLIDLDIHTFLAITYNSKNVFKANTASKEETNEIDDLFMKHIDLFHGNIVQTVKQFLKGIMSVVNIVLK